MDEKISRFHDLQNIVLIGGGDLMAASVQLFKEKKFSLSVIVAPRHIDETLPLNNCSLRQYLTNLEVPFHVVEDINQLANEQYKAVIPTSSIAICFGPAWIFKEQLINRFSLGMYNINAIPIPHYLGGAHYTWQLLNNNREGGCFFQEITIQLDQGDILDQYNFSLTSQANTPNDYFIENINQGLVFINKIADKFISGDQFKHTPYQQINEDRIYLPRLRTDKQGFINWQWTAQDIIKFAQGFDEPYLGAGTFINQQLVRFKGASEIKIAEVMHPFTTGLIIRKTSSAFIVSAPQGFIQVEQILNEQGQCIKNQLKEGMRFHTPIKVLDDALSYQAIITADGFKN